MTTTDMNNDMQDQFQEVAKELHTCLKENQDALANEGLVAELGALIHWTDQVVLGRVTVRDALANYGLSTLLNMRERVLQALEEQHRAADEFPEALSEADEKQQQYRDAFKAVSEALETFMDAVGERRLS